MTNEAQWTPMLKLANIVGIIMAVAALGIIGRYALLLTQAWQGHPRLVG